MKKLILVGSLSALISCGSLATPVTQEDADSYTRLTNIGEVQEAQIQSLQGQLEVKPGDENILASLSAVEANHKVTEDQLQALEEKIITSKYGSLTSALLLIPGIGPWVTMLGPLLVGLLPLAGKRGREHYGKAVKELNPFVGGKVSPVNAITALLKGIGIKHS